MAESDGIRIVEVDATLRDTFAEYARIFGPYNDDSFVGQDELSSFDPATEPAVLALDDTDTVRGVASLMLDGYATEGHARFRILHAVEPAAYQPLVDSMLARARGTVGRVFLFAPEHPGDLGEALEANAFSEARRAYIMLHSSPGHVIEPELPAETMLVPVYPTMAEDWANVINMAFRGQPGRYEMDAARARELLSRERIIGAGTLMACRGGTPSGVVLTVADEENPYGAEIETLAVVPGDQHVGLGRALLRAALRASGYDGRSSVTLSVSTFNKRALALYLDAGFGVHDVRVCWEKSLA